MGNKMTSYGDMEIKCPKCGEMQNTIVWQSLNVTIHPEAREELFQGHINIFRCQKCKFEDQIPAHLMYHDMRKKFCVMLIPLPSLDDEEFFDFFTEDGGVKPISNDMPDYMNKMHVVFHMGELVRYIVFRERLFDYLNNQK